MTVSLVQSNKVILSSGRIHSFEVGLKEDSENYYNLRFVINNNEELIRNIFKKWYLEFFDNSKNTVMN